MTKIKKSSVLKKPSLPKKAVKVKVTGPKKPVIKKEAKKVKVVSADLTPVLEKVAAPVLLPPVVKVSKSMSFWQFAAWFSGVILVVLLVGVIMVYSRYYAAESNINSGNGITNNQREQTRLLSSLTGEQVTEEVATRRPLAVMVENFKTVRPQSGLSFADIVWEAPTEGGVTRFLAIFQKGLPSRLGPVRSARGYFIDWAREYGSIYAHSGGSPEALDAIAKGVAGLQDANEFFYGAAYWRDSALSAPHNLFTDAVKFYDYAEERGWRITAEKLNDFIPSKTETVVGAIANEVMVPYVPLDYDVLWKYNNETGVYIRAMDGKEHLDIATGGALQTKNLIVMFTSITPIPRDPDLRVNITTVGEGNAYLFTGGSMYKGLWQKETLTSNTKFVFEDGKPLPLQAGNTWISVMTAAQEAELEYK